MQPSFAYPSVEAATTQVARWVERAGISTKLVARPWNRFDPVDTLWYLVPSPDWPAYRFCKLAFESPTRGILRCTLAVEKGVDASIAAAYPNGKAYVMDKRWAWPRLMDAVRNGAIDLACSRIAERDLEVKVWLDGGYCHDREPEDLKAPNSDWTYLEYTWSGGRISLKSTQLGDAGFARLQDCTSLTELPHTLDTIEAVEWRWVNWYIGVEGALCPLEPGMDAPGGWNARDIWHNCLEPWHAWLV